MIEYRRVKPEDLGQIVDLQNRNLYSQISPAERADGFLLTAFTAEQFQLMNEKMAVVVASDGGKICGYLCICQADFFEVFPLQKALLEQASLILHQGKPLTSYRHFLANPICIDQAYRGGEIYRGLCQKVLEFIPPTFELALSIISTENTRHLHAIKKAQMEKLGEFTRAEKTFWIMGRFFIFLALCLSS